MLLTDKRLVLVTLLLALLASAFWAGSRVPALNEKALMGGETQLDALGFEMLIQPQPDDPIALRAVYTTINWTQTNLKGMTFGVLFGVGLMTLLSILRKKSFQSDFANALLGMTLGSQLGVCVNCAAPIAHGLRSAGAPVPIMLASMMSSPTLNIIVLSMLFSLFPLYMVLIKIGLTVGFVLIVIPILSRLLAKDATMGLGGAYCEVPTGPPGGDAILKWGPATTWVWRNFGKNLWYIVRTTVPLMLLAGFLGSLMVRVLPLDSLGDLFPQHGKVGILGSMGILALIGLFLPVPIAFDVIVTASLLSAGMPPMYAMVLLFTLGIFSVYALFIIWKSLPKTLILGVSFSLFGLGVTSGLLGYYGFEWNHQRELKIFFEAFGQESTLAGPTVIKINRREPSLPDRTLVSRLLATAVPPEPVAMDTPPGISIHRAAFRPRTTQPGKPFIRLEGAELGLDEPYTFSVHNFLWLSRFRGIASGDVHNDGWVDIVLASDTGVSLYANQQGAGYVRQPIEFPVSSKPHAVNVALVDLNNDGWLDIFFSCYRDGNYVIYNQLGNFRIEDLHPIPNYAGAVMSAAVAFGDVDRDGDMDIALGNWSAGDFVRSPQSLPSSRNILLHNEGSGFRVEPLKGIVGETLSILFSDFNNDGYLDLIEGNDFSPPDYYNLGNGDGTFKMLTRADGVIPHSAFQTMSISSADIDNDLRPEIYLGQISGRMGSGNREFTRVGPHICAELADPEYRRHCERIMTVQSEIIKNKNKKSVAGCLELDEEYRDDCLGVLLLAVGGKVE
jgi:uncharacterized membrane protein YraQ (UPF0718 family)